MIGKPNNLKIIESNKTKGSKQENLLISPMAELKP
jgi:hypothetical protein